MAGALNLISKRMKENGGTCFKMTKPFIFIGKKQTERTRCHNRGFCQHSPEDITDESKRKYAKAKRKSRFGVEK